MIKFNHDAYAKALSNVVDEIQDGRFFAVNCVAVELVSVDNNDYLVIFEAPDCTGPDTVEAACKPEHCIGVLFIANNWSKANAVFTELFGVAMKSGLQGVKEYYVTAV